MPAAALLEKLPSRRLRLVQSLAQVPDNVPQALQTLKLLADATQSPTVKIAAFVLEQSQERLEDVVENLQALALTDAFPGSAKPALLAAASQVDALLTYMRGLKDESEETKSRCPIGALAGVNPIPALSPLFNILAGHTRLLEDGKLGSPDSDFVPEPPKSAPVSKHRHHHHHH